MVDAQKQGMEVRVMQQGVAHWTAIPLVVVAKTATVPKIGRNDPCPCGSGKKYKQCCLAKDQAAERAVLQANEARQQESLDALREAQALDMASNAVIDMIRDGRLDEAERAARDLLVRYPEVHDGYDRLGMVHEARGQFREAADCYRKVVEFVQARPQDYDPEFVDTFLELIAKLDASSGQTERPASSGARPQGPPPSQP